MCVSGGWSVRRRTSSLEMRALQEMRNRPTVVVVVVVEMNIIYYLGGTIALLLQDNRIKSNSRV